MVGNVPGALYWISIGIFAALGCYLMVENFRHTWWEPTTTQLLADTDRLLKVMSVAVPIAAISIAIWLIQVVRSLPPARQ